MKKIFSIFFVAMVFLFSCQEDHELGSTLDKSEIDFDVVQDLSVDPGGNTVILINNTPGTVSMWDYGSGRSTRAQDTVRFPFTGEYVIKFSAMTAGGVVEMDPVSIQVTENNFSYVNDPLWTFLTGGVGHEKSWVLDTDAKFFAGPLSFYGSNNGWLKEGGPWSGGGDTGCYGADCWTWSPDAAWIYDNAMTEGDYGMMTFSLIDGANFHADKPMEGTEEDGTYNLNSVTKKLTINDASILRGYKPAKNGLTGISDWTNYFLFALDENTLRLGVLRDKDVDGEGVAMIVYNFISKEYSDNWVPDGPPPPDEGYNPVFAPGELLQMLAGGPGQSQTWELDVDGNAVDWVKAGIGWTTSSSSSYNWGWNETWVAAAEDSWIRFERLGQNYTRYQDGTTTTGTFTINEETNEITLNGNTLLQNASSWMNPTTNTIKVVKAFPGAVESKGIWFGTSYNAGIDEWLVFHYIIPQ